MGTLDASTELPSVRELLELASDDHVIVLPGSLMKNSLSFIVSVALVAWMMFYPNGAKACSRFTPISLDEICLKADAIVRATAVRYANPPVAGIRELNTPRDVEIEFTINQVIKGENVPDAINVNGYLTDFDDYNDRPVPYDFVRPGGRHGSCAAYEYRQGAEFLLFLKRTDGKLTLYRDALSPVNEQLHSGDDPWILWVQRHLKDLDKKNRGPKRSQSRM